MTCVDMCMSICNVNRFILKNNNTSRDFLQDKAQDGHVSISFPSSTKEMVYFQPKKYGSIFLMRKRILLWTIIIIPSSPKRR
mmetsp:Transcript_16095/g.18591  ORF Transcript_16095/g.18591 Transcript_16095/m.18591 type:complete len:82 (+) Transcript_16095:109-354(+)